MTTFDFYINNLQFHPSIAYTNKSADGLKYILDKLPVGKLLCIGCADGAEVNALNELGYKTTGITIGQNNVDYAKEKFGIDTQVMDMHCLEFDSETFDCCYSSHSFEHCFAPIIHIMEVFTVLKDKGLWYLNHPSYVKGSKETTTIDHHHPNVLPAYLHRDMFEKFGFKVRECEETAGEAKWLLEKDGSLNNVHDAVRGVLNKRGSI